MKFTLLLSQSASRLACILASICMQYGCADILGNDKNDKAANESLATFSSSLTGTWARECFEMEATYTTDRFIVDGPEYTYIVELYSDVYCTGKLATFTGKGTYTIAKGSKEEIFNYDSKSTVAEWNISDSRLVDYFNESGLCGGDFVQDVTKSLTKEACQGIPPYVGSENYDIIKIEGNKLLFGKTSEEEDQSSPEKRPTSLEEGDNLPPYLKS